MNFSLDPDKAFASAPPPSRKDDTHLLSGVLDEVDMDNLGDEGTAEIGKLFKKLTLSSVDESQNQKLQLRKVERENANLRTQRDVAYAKIKYLNRANHMHGILLAIGTGFLSAWASYHSAGKGAEFAVYLYLGGLSFFGWLIFLARGLYDTEDDYSN